MNHNPQRLLALSFELEGLLMLVERRGDRTPSSVYDMLAAKSDELSTGIKELACARLNEEQSEIVEDAPIRQTTVSESTQTDQEIADSVETEETEDATPSAPVQDFTPVTAHEAGVQPQQPVIAISAQPTVSAPATLATAPIKTADEKDDIKLTLNDKFRFRRSLFNGSDAELKEALSTISQLNDIDEVTDYLYNDLCLDPDNQDVIDFLQIISANFK